MASVKRIMVLGLVLVGAGAGGGYLLWRPTPDAPLVGVVRATEVQVASEVGGQLVELTAKKGARVAAGEVVAELSALELTAALAQARATLGAASAARNRVYAGPRTEVVAVLAAEIEKAKAHLANAQAQHARIAQLADKEYATQQTLDDTTAAVTAAEADIAQAQANHAAAKAGPTRQERAIADASVAAAASAVMVLEKRVQKTILRAPAAGVVTVIVAELGENIRTGQPVLAIEATGKQWLSFSAREDALRGLTVGSEVSVDVAQPDMREPIAATVTAVLPLGTFAIWQAERAVGAHDLNTVRLRMEPAGNPSGLEPGMKVRVARAGRS